MSLWSTIQNVIHRATANSEAAKTSFSSSSMLVLSAGTGVENAAAEIICSAAAHFEEARTSSTATVATNGNNNSPMVVFILVPSFTGDVATRHSVAALQLAFDQLALFHRHSLARSSSSFMTAFQCKLILDGMTPKDRCAAYYGAKVTTTVVRNNVCRVVFVAARTFCIDVLHKRISLEHSVPAIMILMRNSDLFYRPEDEGGFRSDREESGHTMRGGLLAHRSSYMSVSRVANALPSLAFAFELCSDAHYRQRQVFEAMRLHEDSKQGGNGQTAATSTPLSIKAFPYLHIVTDSASIATVMLASSPRRLSPSYVLDKLKLDGSSSLHLFPRFRLDVIKYFEDEEKKAAAERGALASGRGSSKGNLILQPILSGCRVANPPPALDSLSPLASRIAKLLVHIVEELVADLQKDINAYEDRLATEIQKRLLARGSIEPKFNNTVGNKKPFRPGIRGSIYRDEDAELMGIEAPAWDVSGKPPRAGGKKEKAGQVKPKILLSVRGIALGKLTATDVIAIPGVGRCAEVGKTTGVVTSVDGDSESNSARQKGKKAQRDDDAVIDLDATSDIEEVIEKRKNPNDATQTQQSGSKDNDASQQSTGAPASNAAPRHPSPAALSHNSALLLSELRRIAFSDQLPVLDHNEYYALLGVNTSYNITTFEEDPVRNAEGTTDSTFLSQRPTLSKVTVAILNSILDVRDLLDLLVSNPDLPASKFLYKIERKIFNYRLLESTYAKEIQSRSYKSRKDWHFVHPSIEGCNGTTLWTMSEHFPVVCQLARQRVYGIAREEKDNVSILDDDDDGANEVDEILLPCLSEEVGPRLRWLKLKVDMWAKGLLRRAESNVINSKEKNLDVLPTLLILVQRRASEQSVTDIITEGLESVSQRQFCSFLHEYAYLYSSYQQSAPPQPVARKEPPANVTPFNMNGLSFFMGSPRPPSFAAPTPKRTMLFSSNDTQDSSPKQQSPTAATPLSAKNSQVVDVDEGADESHGQPVEIREPSKPLEAPTTPSYQLSNNETSALTSESLSVPAALFGEDGDYVDWSDFEGLYPASSRRLPQSDEMSHKSLAQKKSQRAPSMSSERLDQLRAFTACHPLSQASVVPSIAHTAVSKVSTTCSQLSSVWRIAATAAKGMGSTSASPSKTRPHDHLLALHDLAMVTATEGATLGTRSSKKTPNKPNAQQAAVDELFKSLVGGEETEAATGALDVPYDNEAKSINLLEKALFVSQKNEEIEEEEQSMMESGKTVDTSPSQSTTKDDAIDIDAEIDEPSVVTKAAASPKGGVANIKGSPTSEIKYKLASISDNERLLLLYKSGGGKGKKGIPFAAIRIAVNADATCSQLVKWVGAHRIDGIGKAIDDQQQGLPVNNHTPAPFSALSDQCRTDLIFSYEPDAALMKTIEVAGVEIRRLSSLISKSSNNQNLGVPRTTSKASAVGTVVDVHVFQWKKASNETKSSTSPLSPTILATDSKVNNIDIAFDPYDLTMGMAREQLQLQKLIVAKNTVLMTHRMQVSTASKLALLRSLGGGGGGASATLPSTYSTMSASVAATTETTNTKTPQQRDTLIKRIQATVKEAAAATTGADQGPKTINEAWELTHNRSNNTGNERAALHLSDSTLRPSISNFTHNISIKLVLMDEREFRSTLPYELHTRGLTLLPITLPRGDFILSPHCAIERKSFPDLVSSLNSGRLTKQLSRLGEHFSNPVVLIEDSDFVADSAATAASLPPFRFTPTHSSAESGFVYPEVMANLYRSLLRLVMLHKKVCWMWGRSPAHSAAMVARLKGLDAMESKSTSVRARTFGNASAAPMGGFVPLSERIASSNPDPEVCAPSGRDEGQKDSQKVAIAVLARFPGVTSNNIRPLMVRCRSLAGLAALSKKDIIETFAQCGPDAAQNFKNAEMLHNFLHKRYNAF